ncbi:MAG: helix-hairpin-helix domain-containing protein [FCB group bacterium]|jgi:DNA polymerase (family 10)
MVDKKLIKILENISIILEIKGENPFKARAYSNAAQKIKNENIDIHEAVRNNNLARIKGFGEALQKKITDYVQNGKMSYYEKLIEEIPESLIELTKIPNIGPKRAKLLYEQLNISNIDELEKACLDGRLTQVKRFTANVQDEILKSIQIIKASR